MSRREIDDHAESAIKWVVAIAGLASAAVQLHRAWTYLRRRI